MPGPFQRFEIEERIGIGGMAEVFRGRAVRFDGSVDRVVIKKILPQFSEDDHFRSMFLDEAAIVSRLLHPNVVRFLDFGRLDDQLFLAMEWVDGTDVRRLLKQARERRQPLSADEAVFIASEVLAGLSYAHTLKGPTGKPLRIVHRDVSGSNVLLSRAGDVKVSDFGIAKATVRAGRTISGVVKGNPDYMSPEQIAGDDVDARSDVYSTGLLLWEMLAGEHPFAEEPLPRVFQRAAAGDIPPIAKAAPSLLPGLAVAVTRAIEVDRDRRFADANAFRAALQAISAGAGARAALVKRLAAALSPAAREKPRPSPRVALPAAGAVSSYRTPPELPRAPEPVKGGPSAIREGRIGGHGGPIAAIAALGGARALTASHDQTLRIWDLAEGSERLRLEGHTGAVVALASSRDGTLAASGSRDRTVRLWNLNTGSAIRTFEGHRDWVFAVALSADASRVLSGGFDRTLRAWDVAGDRELVLEGHTDSVSCVAFAPGNRAISGGYDKTIRSWDLASGKPLGLFEPDEPMGAVRALSVSADGERAISGGADGLVRIWDTRRGAELFACTGHREPVVCVAWSPDRRLAASGGYDGSLRLWDAEAGHPLKEWSGSDPVLAVAFSADGRFLLSGGADRALVVRDLSR